MLSIDMSGYNSRSRAYWWITTFVGGTVFSQAAVSVLQLDHIHLLWVGALIGVVFIAGMYPIRIPGTQAVITPSDIFVFISALTLGPAAATVVAFVDAFIVSCKKSKRLTSRLGGPALTAISIFVSARLFEWMLAQLRSLELFDSATLLAALLVFACFHFSFNTLLLTALEALKKQVPLFPLWLKSYSWAGWTYAASASAAGLSYLAVKQNSLVSLLAICPILAVIFSTCYFYFKRAEERTRADRQRVEAAEEQTRQGASHLRELEESEARFHSAFNYAAIGMALVAADGRWLQANRALCSLLGHSEDYLLLTNYQSVTHEDDLLMVDRHLAQLLADPGLESPIETRYVNKLGHIVWVLLSASLVREVDRRSPCFIFQVQDITARKRAEERLEHALHDALTDLPNRALFMDHLKLAMARVERHPTTMFAVLFLDLDRFKVINDSLGHLVGDQLLVAIARRLEQCVRSVDTLARLGGDEFTILMEDLASPSEAVELADRIKTALAAPFRLGDHETYISSSVGIAPSNPFYKKPEEILRDADTAMYRAKSLGKARCALFDQDMHASALKRLKLENDLRCAVEREEFSVVYQPIVSLEDLRVVGVEALARWQNDDVLSISPAEFIPVAEEIGCIGRIGQWILEESCRQMREWQERSPSQPPLTISVNLSGKQLAQDNLLEQVSQTLQRTGLNPRYLKLEITETVVMENIEVATLVLEQLRALGVHLSIDDFGTGYSSVSYLRRLPIDTLKIDRSFITQMTKDTENAEIVRAVINLAKSLGMSVVAEGVETREQLELLRQFGCDNAQGYLFSKPITAQQAARLLNQTAPGRGFVQSEDICSIDEHSISPISDYTVTTASLASNREPQLANELPPVA